MAPVLTRASHPHHLAREKQVSVVKDLFGKALLLYQPIALVVVLWRIFFYLNRLLGKSASDEVCRSEPGFGTLMPLSTSVVNLRV